MTGVVGGGGLVGVVLAVEMGGGSVGGGVAMEVTIVGGGVVGGGVVGGGVVGGGVVGGGVVLAVGVVGGGGLVAGGGVPPVVGLLYGLMMGSIPRARPVLVPMVSPVPPVPVRVGSIGIGSRGLLRPRA